VHLEARAKGAHGGFFMLADVGSLEKVASYGIINKRIPQWMMPATASMPSGFDIAMLHKREVDIVHGVTPAQGTHLTAIEIGYRSEYDPDFKKVEEKRLQHALTCQALGRHYNAAQFGRHTPAPRACAISFSMQLPSV
jgi:hypothetical protein